MQIAHTYRYIVIYFYLFICLTTTKEQSTKNYLNGIVLIEKYELKLTTKIIHK